MTEFKLFGEAPKHDFIEFGHEDEIATQLEYLLSNKPTCSLLPVESKSVHLTEKILLTSSGIASAMDERDMASFWLSVRSNSEDLALARYLFDLMAQLWWAESAGSNSTDEFQILSFGMKQEQQLDDFFKKCIKPLLSKFYGKHFLIVLDVSEVGENHPTASRLVSLVRQMMTYSGANTVHGIILKGGTEGLQPVDPRIQPDVDGAGSERDFDSVEGAYEAIIRLAQPILLLNGTVIKDVVHYLQRIIPGGDKAIEQLLSKDLVRWLYGGSLKSNSKLEDYVQSLKTNMPRFDAVYSDVVPNSSKILSFQTPDKLLATQTPLKELERFAANNMDILGTCAAWLGHRTNPNSKEAQRVYDFLIETTRVNGLIDHSNISHIKYLISYLSQIALSKQYHGWDKTFPLLKHLTMNFADYISLQSPRDYDQLYKVSRWVTNLGYVFDHSAPANYRFNTRHKERQDIFGKAAKILAETVPQKLLEVFDTAYATGWQLYDSGDYGSARASFVAGAEDTLMHPLNETLLYHGVTTTKEDLSDRLLCLGLAAYPENPADEFIEKRALNIWHKYGGITSPSELYNTLAGKVEIMGERVQSIVPIGPTILVCRWDLLVGLYIRAYLFKKHSVFSPIAIISKKQDIDHVLENVFGKEAILVGCPATPAGIGEYISEHDPILTKLYQTQGRSHFAHHSVTAIKGRQIVLIGGFGGRGNYQAWDKFCQEHQTFFSHIGGKNMVLENFAVSVVASVLKHAGSSLGNEITKRIAEAVKKRLPEESQDQEQLEDITKDLVAAGKQLQYSSKIDVPNVGGYSTLIAEALAEEVMDDKIVFLLLSLNRELDSADVSPEHILDFANVMHGITGHLTDSRSWTVSEQNHLDGYRSSFRDFRTEGKNILRHYKQRREFDQRKMNTLITRLQGVSKDFMLEFFSEGQLTSK